MHTDIGDTHENEKPMSKKWQGEIALAILKHNVFEKGLKDVMCEGVEDTFKIAGISTEEVKVFMSTFIHDLFREGFIRATMKFERHPPASYRGRF